MRAESDMESGVEVRAVTMMEPDLLMRAEAEMETVKRVRALREMEPQ